MKNKSELSMYVSDSDRKQKDNKAFLHQNLTSAQKVYFLNK